MLFAAPAYTWRIPNGGQNLESATLGKFWSVFTLREHWPQMTHESERRRCVPVPAHTRRIPSQSQNITVPGAYPAEAQIEKARRAWLLEPRAESLARSRATRPQNIQLGAPAHTLPHRLLMAGPWHKAKKNNPYIHIHK